MLELYEARTPAEQLAVWTMRGIGRSRRTCRGRDSTAFKGLLSDLANAVAALKAADTLMAIHQGAGLKVAASGDLTLTADERHLLRGTAATQAGADRLLEIELFEIVPHWQVRGSLRGAVILLGAALGAAGHWLPRSHLREPLPGAALRVARLRGTDLRISEVAWP
jgi:hypothetical protein